MSYLFRVFLPGSLGLCSGVPLKICFWIVRKFLFCSSGRVSPFRTGAKWKGLPLALVRVMPCGKTKAVKEPFLVRVVKCTQCPCCGGCRLPSLPPGWPATLSRRRVPASSASEVSYLGVLQKPQVQALRTHGCNCHGVSQSAALQVTGVVAHGGQRDWIIRKMLFNLCFRILILE